MPVLKCPRSMHRHDCVFDAGAFWATGQANDGALVFCTQIVLDFLAGNGENASDPILTSQAHEVIIG